MGDLLADEREAVRQQRVKTVTMFAFCVAGVALGVAAAPLTPLAIGDAFVSVGQFTAERVFERRAKREPTPAALFYAARKHLGWE
jgi:hypothetical protein